MGYPVPVHQSGQRFHKSLTIYIFDMKNAMVSAWETELRLVSKSLITLFEWEKGEAKDLLKSCLGLYWQKPGVSCFLCGLTIELIEQRGEYPHFLLWQRGISPFFPTQLWMLFFSCDRTWWKSSQIYKYFEMTEATF